MEDRDQDRGNGVASATKLAVIERQAMDAPDHRNEYVTALGVKLKLKPVAMLKINMAVGNVPVPKPPRLAPKTDDPNEPWIENHADPKYVEEMRRYEQTTQNIGINVALWEGTEVLEVPEGMFPPDSDEWIAVVEDDELMEGYAPRVRRDSVKLRYVDYVKLYACNDADFNVLANKLRQWSGSMLERDVEDAEDSFRDSAGRDADSGVGDARDARRGRARR